MKRLHLIVGALGVIAFVATGVYMRVWHGGMENDQQQLRLLLRSRHIYILLASLLNLALAMHHRPRETAWRWRIARVGSLMIAAAPALLLAAFVRDATMPEAPGCLVLPAIITVVAGTFCCLIGGDLLDSRP
jgi:peptidoglycan/LPS O-acetylase OafA/YrhL